MKHLVFIFIFFTMSSVMLAQDEVTWQDFIDEMSEDEIAEEQGWLDKMEELEILHSNPVDINKATREDFLQIPILTQRQIEDIEEYIIFNHGIYSMAELMSIQSLDYNTRRLLSLFFYVDNSTLKSTKKQTFTPIKQEFSTRMDIPLYYRAGYSYSPEDGGYRGSTLYNRIIYLLRAGNRLQAGVSMEKDQGEPFRNNRGWDSYGFHAMLQNIGPVKRLIAGDYRLSFGEGLVINTGYSLGKLGYGLRTGKGIRAKLGTDEINFLRGAALTLNLNNVDITFFASHRRWDSSLNDDGTVKTIDRDGLHRTDSELDKKNNLHSSVMGADVSWAHQGFKVGATGYYQLFNRMLVPGTARYRQIYPHGDKFGAFGVHYGYESRRFIFSGETSYSTEQQGIATLNRVEYRVHPMYKLSAIQRYYSARYYSFYASAMSESSGVQNENAVMLRLDANPLRRWKIMAYMDFFYHPWVRYGMTKSDSGQDIMLQSEHKLDSRNTLTARYQLKRKTQYDEMLTHHRIRVQWNHLHGNQWRYQTTALFHNVGSNGVALAENIRYESNSEQWRASLFVAYFHTDDYDSRVYAYEPMLYNTFYIPSFYGHGGRISGTLRWQTRNKKLMLECKYGCTKFFDRSTQSSGMQQIFSAWKNDISVQLRVKL